MNRAGSTRGEGSFELLEDYMDYLSGVKGRSQLTVKEYRYDLLNFFRYLLGETDLGRRWRESHSPYLPLEEGADEEEQIEAYLPTVELELLAPLRLRDFHAYLSYLSRQKQAGPAIRARRASSLKGFFQFLHQSLHLLPENPCRNLELPKIPKRKPRYLQLEESELLLEESRTQESSEFQRLRDYCILTLFLNTGLRLAELCGLDLESWQGDTLRVIGKGNKERVVALNGACIDALQQYLPLRADLGLPPQQEALFISRRKQRMARSSIQLLVKRHLQGAGLDSRKYSTHKLRHTAATLMYQYGKVDIRCLQQILGHESVATTEIYTHLGDDNLHQAVESHPLARLRHPPRSGTKDTD